MCIVLMWCLSHVCNYMLGVTRINCGDHWQLDFNHKLKSQIRVFLLVDYGLVASPNACVYYKNIEPIIFLTIFLDEWFDLNDYDIVDNIFGLYERCIQDQICLWVCTSIKITSGRSWRLIRWHTLLWKSCTSLGMKIVMSSLYLQIKKSLWWDY